MPLDSDPGSVLPCASSKSYTYWRSSWFPSNDTTVLFFFERSRNGSEKQAKTDGSGPLVGGKDTRIICKNLGPDGILGCLFGSSPVLQLRKCLWFYCVHFCLLKRPQTCFKRSLKSRAKLWVSVLSLEKFKFSSLTEVCDRSDSPFLHRKKDVSQSRRMGAPWWWRVWRVSEPACLGICNIK